MVVARGHYAARHTGTVGSCNGNAARTQPPGCRVSDRLWLLKLVPNVRYGRLLTSIGILVVLLGWFWLTGIFLGVSEGASGATAFFAVIIAYIVPVFHYITE